MKVTDKGITVDMTLLDRAVNHFARTFDLPTLFKAITVNPELPRSRPDDVVSINTNGSTAISYALYDPTTQKLVVRFVEGGTYRYDKVSLQTAFDFAAADSKGAFFHSFIRNRHIATKV